MDLRAQHREALQAADDLIRRVTDDDLTRPTPCAAWTLADLLAHMVGQHDGFAAAARDGDAPRSAYAPVRFTPDSWKTSIANLLDVFARADLDANAVEIELSATPLPIARLVAAQFLDTVVHTWDVARALGEPYQPPDDAAALVARITDGIPDDERRTATNAAFAPARPDGTSTWERTLARLGRDPAWQPDTVGDRA